MEERELRVVVAAAVVGIIPHTTSTMEERVVVEVLAVEAVAAGEVLDVGVGVAEEVLDAVVGVAEEALDE